MTSKVLLPVKNAEDVYTIIKFSKKPIIEMVESGTHNTKARTKYYLKTVFTPTSNGYLVEEFEKGEKTPREVFSLTEGECKYLICETLHEYDGNTQVLYFENAVATLSSFTKAPETVEW